MLRFSAVQLHRLSVREPPPRAVPLGAPGDSSNDPIELSDSELGDPESDDVEDAPSSEDEVQVEEEEQGAPSDPGPSGAQSGGGPPSSSSASVKSADVPPSDLRLALRIGESSVVPGQPGVFAVADIPANSLVTVYTYDQVVNTAMLDAMSDAPRDAVNRYAVAGPGPDVTFILDVPVDQRHVGAFANEPPAGKAANMALHAEIVALPNGDVFYVLALYTCNEAVSSGTELVWSYGKSYEAVRQKEGYAAGRPCTSKDPLEPSLEDVVQRIVAARAGKVGGILYNFEDEDESSDSSDYAYQGRAEVQPRRVQPRRA